MEAASAGSNSRDGGPLRHRHRNSSGSGGGSGDGDRGEGLLGAIAQAEPADSDKIDVGPSHLGTRPGGENSSKVSELSSSSCLDVAPPLSLSRMFRGIKHHRDNNFSRSMDFAFHDPDAIVEPEERLGVHAQASSVRHIGRPTVQVGFSSGSSLPPFMRDDMAPREWKLPLADEVVGDELGCLAASGKQVMKFRSVSDFLQADARQRSRATLYPNLPSTPRLLGDKAGGGGAKGRDGGAGRRSSRRLNRQVSRQSNAFGQLDNVQSSRFLATDSVEAPLSAHARSGSVRSSKRSAATDPTEAPVSATAREPDAALDALAKITKDRINQRVAEKNARLAAELDSIAKRVISLQSPLGRQWSTLIFFAVWLNTLVLLFMVAFPPHPESNVSGIILTYAVDAIMLTNVYVRTRMEVKVENGLKTLSDAKAIRQHYKRHGLLVDVLALLPLELVALAWGGWGLYPFLRLNRLLAFPKLFIYFDHQTANIRAKSQVIRVKLFGAIAVLVIHLLTCGWYFIGCPPAVDGDQLVRRCVDSGWVTQYKIRGDPEVVLYIDSLYWTVSSMTSVGYGDFVAQTPFEKVYSVVTMMVGVCLFSFVMGIVAAAAQRNDTKRNNYQDKMLAVKEYLNHHGLSLELRQTVDDYYYAEWLSKRGVSNTFYNELPEVFRANVAMQMNRKHLMEVSVFQGCSETFLANLALRLRPRSFLANTWILNMGDATTDMYFVDSGSCQVIAYPDEESLILSTTEAGQYFGEVSLLFGVPRTASIFAAEHTDVFTLAREDLMEVLSYHPEEKELFAEQENELFDWFKNCNYVDASGLFGGRLEIDSNKELIRKVPLFESLSDDVLELIAKGLGQIAFEPGERIIEKGSIANEMYIINKGVVVVTGDHDSDIFATLGDGAYFGELSLIFDQPRTANVSAVSHSLLFVLFKQTFDKIMERCPEQLSHIIKLAQDRIDNDRKRREQGKDSKKAPVKAKHKSHSGATSGEEASPASTHSNAGQADVELQAVPKKEAEGGEEDVVVIVEDSDGNPGDHVESEM